MRQVLSFIFLVYRQTKEEKKEADSSSGVSIRFLPARFNISVS